MTLRLLSRWSGYEFADGAFDVRGWAVATEEDAPLGSVHDMVLDASGAPRYLAVRLRAGDCVLLPIGQARVGATDDVVLVTTADAGRLAELPRFEEDETQLTADYEGMVSDTLHGLSNVSPTTPGRLESMSRGALRVAAGECDPSGWPVLFAGGDTAGVVRDMLVDTEAMKVRYFVCELRGGRRVLIPAVYARTDEEAEHLVVDVLSSEEAAQIPAMTLPLSAEEEARLHELFTGGVTRGEAHRHPRYNPEHFYGPRRPRIADRRAERRPG